MRPTAGLQQDPLPWMSGSDLQVALLRNGSLEAAPVAAHGPTLPFAEFSIQNVLDVLHDEVDGHWWETDEVFTKCSWSLATD